MADVLLKILEYFRIMGLSLFRTNMHTQAFAQHAMLCRNAVNFGASLIRDLDAID